MAGAGGAWCALFGGQESPPKRLLPGFFEFCQRQVDEPLRGRSCRLTADNLQAVGMCDLADVPQGDARRAEDGFEGGAGSGGDFDEEATGGFGKQNRGVEFVTG